MRTYNPSPRALLSLLIGCLLALSGVVTPAIADDRVGAVAGESEDGPIGLRDNDEAQQATFVVPRYGRANYTWPYGSGPYYGTVDRSLRHAPGSVHTSVGVFRLHEGRLPFPQQLQATNRLGELPSQHFLVQFHPEIVDRETWKQLPAQLEALGGKVQQYLPVTAFIARLTPAAHAALESKTGLMALEPYHGAFKLSPTIGRSPLANRVKAISDTYSLEIRLFDDEDPQAVARRITALGGEVTALRVRAVTADIHKSKLADVAAIDAVQMVHEDLPIYPLAEETTATVMTGRFNGPAPGQGAVPYHDAGIVGTGQVLMVLDSGISINAADLSQDQNNVGTPGPAHRKVLLYSVAIGGQGDDRGCDSSAQGGFTHGHLVAATALGNADHTATGGIEFLADDDNTPPNRWRVVGVAPGAKLVAYDAHITPGVGSCGDPELGVLLPGTLYDPGEGQGSLDQAHDVFGARVHNLSWGSSQNAYTFHAADIDEFLFDSPNSMVFVSAGNGSSDSDYDGIPDAGTLGTPATAKNAVAVGSHPNADDFGDDPALPLYRSGFSAVGPATGSGRVAPLIMAPGQDPGSMGVGSEYACRSGENEQSGPVVCDLISGLAGTSFSSAAASGAALIIRDYFEEGFYPDGTDQNQSNAADRVPDVSGALVKSVLISSARMLGTVYDGTRFSSYLGTGATDYLTRRERFNNEQGYGAIKLDNALPLATWAPSVTGLIVADGGIPGGINSLGGTISGAIATGETHESTFEVCDNEQEIRIGLSWIEDAGDALVNNLDLEIVAPDGITTYLGNYYTDDDDRDGTSDPTVEACPCPFDDGLDGNTNICQGRHSIPECQREDGSFSPRDQTNPTEGVHLSPNPDFTFTPAGNPIFKDGTCLDGGNAGAACGNDQDCPGGSCDGGTNQIQLGSWTIRVIAPSTIANGPQRYALSIAGGVCLGSSVRLDDAAYVCNDELQATVTELDEPGVDDAAGLTELEIEQRTTFDVLAFDVCDNGITSCSDAGDCFKVGGACNAELVVDTETGSGIGFTKDPTALRFVSSASSLSDSTSYDPGNGVLDVHDGNRVRVTYRDKSNGSDDPDKRRTSIASVGCKTQIAFGNIVFEQLGRDTSFLVLGGCERNARGQFEFGFPDRYMDAGEVIGYRFAFASNEPNDLEHVQVGLSCVYVDADSPAVCRPDSDDCADPNRENNRPCDQTAGGVNQAMTILDTPKLIDRIDARAALSTSFTIHMSDPIFDSGQNTTSPKVEMILTVKADTSGKSGRALAFNRMQLNVDEESFLYSTDFPSGGVAGVDQIVDRNNNGLVEDPTTVPGDPTRREDYRFESKQFSSLIACTDVNGAPVSCNTNLGSPWNFDVTDGNFRSGILPASDDEAIFETIAQWGEDKNFNNRLDGVCAIDSNIPCDTFPDDVAACGDTNPACEHIEDRDPVNMPTALLDQSWSTGGGCGWQTRAPGSCSGDPTRGCYIDSDCAGAGSCSGAGQATGGIWHTGRIGSAAETACSLVGNDGVGQCQLTEAISGTDGRLTWFEMITTPIISKVNQQNDADGDPVFRAEIVDMAWNQAVDLADNQAAWWWELDTDRDRLQPVDLYSDTTFLNLGFGPYGAARGAGNPSLTGGWSMFADLDPRSNKSENGGGPTSGNNREGYSGCFFEDGEVAAGNLSFLGLAGPADDDVAEGHCPDPPDAAPGEKGATCTYVCAGNPETVCNPNAAAGQSGSCFRGCSDPDPGNAIPEGVCQHNPGFDCDSYLDCNFGTCENAACNGSCDAGTCNGGWNDGFGCAVDADCEGDCIFPDEAGIDRFVTANGPIRNMDLFAFNGPDMRFEVLEDIYGPSGNSFQGSIGIVNFESDVTNEAKSSYGIGVDDLVISWREFRLVQDQTDCDVDFEPDDPGGSCATVNFDASPAFDSRSRLAITVTESSPSGNDCDGDGNLDLPPDFDCNDNGMRDLYVLATTIVEPIGERVLCEEQSPGVYIGDLPVSSAYDVPGTLFVQSLGTTDPSVTVRYRDLDDGTGQICKNDLNAEGQGLIEATALLPTIEANLQLEAIVLDDFEGDGDRIADDGETIDMFVTFSNKGDTKLTDIRLRLQTNDPKIECIQLTTALLGDLEPDEKKQSSTAFRFKVGTVGRTSVDQTLNLELRILASGDGFDSILAPQEISLLADLDLVGGSGPTTFVEGFESGFGQFTTMHLDEPLNPPPGDLGNDMAGVINADGHRCQYSDPDWEASVSFGTDAAENCYPNPDGQPDTYYWQTTTNRAFLGSSSLYWGIELAPALGQTTPTAQLEAIRTTEPINFGWDDVCSITRTVSCSTDADCAPPACPGCQAGESCVPAHSELSFKHQISMIDHRSVGAVSGRAADRGVVHLQLADESGIPTSEWIKIVPYLNLYDSQGNDNYFNCTFDPADDGNTEDDFFDPDDPNRSEGPSSTCFPEFTFTHQGDSFMFGPDRLGDASDGPGLPGGPADGGAGTGVGTWIQPVFNLQAYRGTRAYLRFLIAGLKLGGTVAYEDAFEFNPDPGDDGWWIDDVRVSDTLTTPATLEVDTKDNDALPQCGPSCTTVNASLSAEPASLTAPGSAVRLDASASSAPQCTNGILQYRFVKNGTLLRDWTDNPQIVDAPSFDANYSVDVRCATDVTCNDSDTRIVAVVCPSTAAADVTLLAKAGGAEFDVSGQFTDLAIGNLLDLRSSGYLASTLSGTQVHDPNVSTTLPLLSTPNGGDGKWILLKGGCQATFWGSNCSSSDGGSCTLGTERNVFLP